MRGKKVPLGISAALAMMVLTLAPAATASHWPSATGVLRQGTTKTFYYSGLTAEFAQATDHARVNVLNPTVLTALKTSYHDYPPGTVYADISVMDEAYNQPWAGLAECNIWQAAGVCRHKHIKYDLSNPWPDQVWRQSLACHENGHGVGLLHYPPQDPAATFSCMAEGNYGVNIFNSHDPTHINAYYHD